MIEDTVCRDCPFKEKGFKECPNRIETFWHEQGNRQPKLVTDCAPKRTLLMVQELYNRCFGMQEQINQLETQIIESRANVKALTNVFEQLKSMISTEQTKQIEISGT